MKNVLVKTQICIHLGTSQYLCSKKQMKVFEEKFILNFVDTSDLNNTLIVTIVFL